MPWAKKQSEALGKMSFEELCRDTSVKKQLLSQLLAHGKANDLKGFENVRSIHLESSPFSVENDLLTPTFKLKR